MVNVDIASARGMCIL